MLHLFVALTCLLQAHIGHIDAVHMRHLPMLPLHQVATFAACYVDNVDASRRSTVTSLSALKVAKTHPNIARTFPSATLMSTLFTQLLNERNWISGSWRRDTTVLCNKRRSFEEVKASNLPLALCYSARQHSPHSSWHVSPQRRHRRWCCRALFVFD